MGDYIIQYYISQQMNKLFGEHLTVTMPTRSHLTGRNLHILIQLIIHLSAELIYWHIIWIRDVSGI